MVHLKDQEVEESLHFANARYGTGNDKQEYA